MGCFPDLGLGSKGIIHTVDYGLGSLFFKFGWFLLSILLQFSYLGGRLRSTLQALFSRLLERLTPISTLYAIFYIESKL